ncbi:MAG: trypsin-like serine peptidase [Acidimicrobiia bacterium]
MTPAKIPRILVALAVAAGLLAAGSAGKPVDRPDPAAEHQRIVDFWTWERVAQAVPRDFYLDPGKGFIPSKGGPPPGKGGGGGGGGDTVIGASWENGGTVADTTGKVLFAFGDNYYVCSASVVVDSTTDQSTILTAAHCVYDEASGTFAQNWTFIPNYDAAPAPLDTSGSFCADTLYGCWTARAIVVSDGYTTAGGFNSQATVHDFAFVQVGPGGHYPTTELDVTVGGQGIQFTTGVLGDPAWAFGYPAAKKYKGKDLIYCKGPLGTDPFNSDLTYRLDCNMTGGSSGGPWFQSFDEATGAGVLMSLNSYGYSSVKNAMHGPKFNAETEALYDAIETADGNLIVNTH